MADDWQRGDLARCIYDGWPEPTILDPKLGDTLRVSAVTTALAPCGKTFVMLGFDERPPVMCWDAAAFTKLRPVNSPCGDGYAQWLRDKVGFGLECAR